MCCFSFASCASKPRIPRDELLDDAGTGNPRYKIRLASARGAFEAWLGLNGLQLVKVAISGVLLAQALKSFGYYLVALRGSKVHLHRCRQCCDARARRMEAPYDTSLESSPTVEEKAARLFEGCPASCALIGNGVSDLVVGLASVCRQHMPWLHYAASSGGILAKPAGKFDTSIRRAVYVRRPLPLLRPS